MKVTKSYIKQIIKEELERTLSEKKDDYAFGCVDGTETNIENFTKGLYKGIIGMVYSNNVSPFPCHKSNGEIAQEVKKFLSSTGHREDQIMNILAMLHRSKKLDPAVGSPNAPTYFRENISPLL
mgnify:CR=1 FL=1